MKREELINTYIKVMKAEDKSNGTIEKYLIHINEFFNFIDENKINLFDVKPRDIKLYRNSNPNLSKATKNLKLSSVSSFYSFLLNDMEMINYNPCASIKSLKIKDRKEETPLNNIQIHWLLNGCKNIRDRAIIEVLANTGLRISELVNITLDDYNYAKQNDGELYIIGKGDKIRRVYLNDKTMEDIDKYLNVRKNSKFNNLFISNTGNIMNKDVIGRTLKTTAKRSGRFTDEEVKRIHNHLLRHSCFTNLSNSGVPIEVISKLAGHSNINTTTKIYVHVSNERTKEAMKNFSI